MYLNEATLLNNVRVRYSKDLIYVSQRTFICILWYCISPKAHSKSPVMYQNFGILKYSRSYHFSFNNMQMQL